MTEQEYKNMLSEIEKRVYKEKKELAISYNKEHARFQVGDILHDDSWGVTIKVTKVITVWDSKGDKLPFSRYRGEVLTQKLEPRKNGVTYQLNDINNNNPRISKL